MRLTIIYVGLILSMRCWADSDKTLIVQDAVTLQDGAVKERVCAVLMAHLELPPDSPAPVVIARTETFHGLDPLAGTAQAEASRDPEEIKAAFGDSLLHQVAQDLHQSRIVQGHFTYPLNAASPYRKLNSIVFGAQWEGKEYPIKFGRANDSAKTKMVRTEDGSFVEVPMSPWNWTVDKPYSIHPDLVNSTERSKGTQLIDPQSSEIPEPVLRRIQSFDMEKELLGSVHQREFADLVSAEKRGVQRIDVGEKKYYSVKDANENTIGYMVTLNATSRSRADGNIAAVSDSLFHGRKLATALREVTVQRSAYFDLSGNRVDDVREPSHSGLQGRFVKSKTSGEELKADIIESSFELTPYSKVEVGLLRPARSKSTITLQDPNAFSIVGAGEGREFARKDWQNIVHQPEFNPFDGQKFESWLNFPRVVMTGNGKYLLTLNSGGSLYETQTGKLIGTYGIEGIDNGYFSSDGKRLYLATYDGTVHVVAAISGKKITSIQIEEPDTHRPITASVTSMGEFKNGNIYINFGRTPSRNPRTYLLDPINRAYAQVAEFQPFANVDAAVESFGDDLTINVKAKKSLALAEAIEPFGVKLNKAEPPSYELRKLVTLPKSKYDPEISGMLLSENYNWFDSGIAQDGNHYAAALSYSGDDLSVWRIKKGGGHTAIPLLNEDLTAIAFMPHSSILATAETGRIKIWDLSENRCAAPVAEIDVGESAPYILSFSRDRKTLLYRNDKGGIGTIKLP